MEEEKNLKVSYHREMKKNYLMIEAEERKDQRFETKMLVGNTIEGLLKLRVRKTDSRCQFCYEITSKQPLKRLLETKEMGAEQIKNLLLGIAQTLARMEEYLLSEEQIILDADFIYVDPENFFPELCLLPGKKGDFPKEFSNLLQSLLDKVDHQDKEAVVMIYGLYRESLKENYGLDNLLRWLVKKECPDMDNDKKERESEIIKEKAQSLERPVKEEPEPKTAFPFKEIFFCGMIVPGVLTALWLWKGSGAVYRLMTRGIVLVAGGILISAVGIGVFIRRWRHGSEPFLTSESSGQPAVKSLQEPSDKARPFNKDMPAENSWQVIFSEEEQEEVIQTEEEDEEEDSHTVLLWSKETKEIRRLVSEDGQSESISIPYFPFLIGKQESLTDYTLSKDTVSRIHVRLDQNGDDYFLTDLNSTNGTAVNGRKLENNETVGLEIGDQIEIADVRFSFR